MTDPKGCWMTDEEIRERIVAEYRLHHSAPLSLDGEVSSSDVIGRVGYLDACESRTEAEDAELRLLTSVFYHGRKATREWYDGVDMFADALPDDEDPAQFAKLEVNGRVFYVLKDDND